MPETSISPSHRPQMSESLPPKDPVPRVRTSLDRLALLLGQWFGTGLSPVGPGTVGSVGALPLFWIMRDLHVFLYWGLTVVISGLGILISQRCSEVLGEKDPSSVVIDEVAGVLIALGLVQHGPLWLLGLAWILFRVFDIAKPGLIYRAQYWSPAGVGIMIDDVIAGAVAGAIASTTGILIAYV